MDAKVHLVKSVWNEIRAHLQGKRDHIHEEISCYPTPIAGCDQQFNYLLEQRTAASREWAQLNEAESESLATEDPIKIIDGFILSSNCIDSEAKKSIRRTASTLKCDKVRSD